MYLGTNSPTHEIFVYLSVHPPAEYHLCALSMSNIHYDSIKQNDCKKTWQTYVINVLTAIKKY